MTDAYIKRLQAARVATAAPAPPPPPAPPAGQNAHVAGAVQNQARLEAPPEPAERYPEARGQMNMIQKGRPTNREQKLITRQVNMAVMAPPAVPEYLKGSETSITFSRADHAPAVVRPGHAPLVLDAQICGYAMSKVFMDGGSRINIIFADTLRKMNRSVENLPGSDITFHGIVPGKAVLPLGTLQLQVVFGEPGNFRSEKVDFEVVDWKSQYHAILGRPTFARFMAVPHYAYLQLKMPGPKGVITVKGNFQKSDSCDREFSKISEMFGMEATLADLAVSNDRTLMPEHKKMAVDRAFSATNDTRSHQVHPTDPTKTVNVSSSLPIA